MRRSAAHRLAAGTALLACLVAAPPAGAGGGPPGGAPPPRVVRAEAVVQEKVRDEVSAVGTVEPRLYTKVAARVEGIVKVLHVTEGAEVEENAPLATIDPEPLRLALAAAKARLDASTEHRRLLEAGSRAEDIAAAKASVAEAEARLALARDAAARARALADPARPVIDPAKAEDAAREESAAAARLEALRQLLRRAESGARPEEVAEAKADEARTQAEVDLAQWNLDRHVVRSPVAGRVLRTMTEVGQWLGKGDVVCEVMVVSTVLARVGVGEREIADVALKADAVVAADAYPRIEFPGTVSRIVPGAEAATRAFAVRISVPNEHATLGRHPLMVGMYVRARIAYGPQREALLVPLDAVVEDARGAAVFVLDGGVAKRTAVRRGAAHGWRVEVEAPGLAPGALVAFSGAEGLRDGEPVVAVGLDGRPVGGAPGAAPGGAPRGPGGSGGK
ncbi:MAG: efflux RND transporter periplasmic adaptor subunit [Planctomycetes bacterium]|nr:efflux RND transporter periplasmic adaptor subunit [Planctomycetota bacterium]